MGRRPPIATRTDTVFPYTTLFRSAPTLEPASHVVMQAAVQRYIDSSVSKTINLPADISFEAFKDVYQQAYDLGCKGCTTFRPNEITGAVLSVGARETLAESADHELVPADRHIARMSDVCYMTATLSRTHTTNEPSHNPPRP